MNMKTMSAVAAFAVALSVVAEQPGYLDRWVHVRNDLATDAKLDHFLEVVSRGAECGFNGILFDGGIDGEGFDFDGWTGSRRARLEAAKKVCREKSMEIVPMLWSVGRAHALVSHDPTLAEGIPVRGVPYRAHGERAVFDGSGAAVRRDVFGGVQTLDAKGRRHMSAKLDVKPFRRYRVNVKARISGFTDVSGEGAKKVPVRSSLSIGVSLPKGGSRENFAVRRFADGDVSVTFDFISLDVDSEVLSVGIAGRATQGTAVIECADVREIGVRRPVVREGAPFVVRDAATGTAYAEGRDYVAPPSDASAPREGDADVAIAIPAGSAIKLGAALLIDAYEAARRGDRQVGACMANPGLYAFFEKTAPILDELLDHPRKWFLSMDEIRAGGTCEACAASGMDLAHALAHCLAKQRDAIRKVRPDAIIYAWCDMYDPFVNAKPRKGGYVMCKGDYASDAFLAPRDIVAVVWGGQDTALKSLRHFAANGVPTLYATFYDVHSPEHFRVRGATETANQVPGCRGLMYTTWVRGGKYDLLGAFGELMKSNSKPLPMQVSTEHPRRP